MLFSVEEPIEIEGVSMWKVSVVMAVAALLCFVFSVPAHAESIFSHNKTKEVQLEYNLKWDLAVTAIMGAGFLGTEAFESRIASTSCRWCGVNSFDNWGHQNLKWSNKNAANITSHVTAFALAPMFAFGLQAFASSREDRLGEFPINALLITEATSVAAMFTQILKFSTGRQRPLSHYDGEGASNTSFCSGHTTIAFALAVSSGMIASMRQYKLTPWIWGAGLTIASTTGYLRIASDRHYLTDVIGGAVIGSAIGFAIPYFFHKSKENHKYNIMVSPVSLDNGFAFNVLGTF